MAAPTFTARVTPLGTPLKDGYRTLITFAADPDVLLWEKGVTPPGEDGGDAIDQTTMHNTTRRRSAPRSLTTLTEATFRAAYQPASYGAIIGIINVETVVSIAWPDGTWMAFYGFLRTFQPDELVEGTQPEATCTITPTNWDYVNHVEAGPAFGTVP